jgi:hypothetical protein
VRQQWTSFGVVEFGVWLADEADGERILNHDGQLSPSRRIFAIGIPERQQAIWLTRCFTLTAQINGRAIGEKKAAGERIHPRLH